MKRPFPLLLLAYIAGIFIGNYVFFPLKWIFLLILLTIILLTISVFVSSKKPALFLAPFIFFLLGFLFINRLLHPSFPINHLYHFAGEEKYILEGVLYQPPEVTGEKTRFYVRGERILGQEESLKIVGNILLTAPDKNHDLRYGDRIRFVAKLYLPRGATNPGAFDYQKFLARRGIWVTAYVKSSSEIVRVDKQAGHPFFHFIEASREKIRNFLEVNAPWPYGGIIKALVLGEKGDIDRETNEKFIIAGVNHILSISGLHVALVAAFFFGVARLFMKLFPSLLLRWPLNKMAASMAIIPVIFYTFIAGLGVAAVRSTIMMLSLLLALLLDRWRDLYDALFLAAFLILVVSPGALFDISFQLSFLAVLAIIYLMPRFGEYFSFLKIWPYQSWLAELPTWKRKMLFYLMTSLLTTTAAILGTGPIVGYYFNRLSFAGFFANLVLVPLLGLGNTILTLLTAFFIFWAKPLAEGLNYINVFLLKISLALVDLFSSLPGASWRISTPTILEIILIYGAILLTANLKRWKRSFYLLLTIIGFLSILQLYTYYSQAHNKEMKVTFLDVGQGDAIVLFFPQGKVMVIDGGGSPDGSFDPGERIVAPYLWKEKRKTINYLVNTHPHPDHLLGLLFLLKNFQIEQVWSNGEFREGDVTLAEFQQLAGKRLSLKSREGEPLDINGVKVEILHPPLENKEKGLFWGNNASLVMRLTFKEVSFLFTGDIEAAAEDEIAGKFDNLQTLVMKVPHHGSKTSSTWPFIEKVKPAYAVFSVRSGGKYPLPNREILERYEKINAQIFMTKRHGAITFITDGKRIQIKTFLSPSTSSP
ncbi:MAG: DNA internalization-related competence protein ComEC/Rec2 [Thermodesulfobacteriota bacterium]